MLGLMIVPIIAPVGRDISARVPATPNAGPRYRSANACGRSRSTSRMAASSLSSKRLPATAASRFGSDGPKFASGNRSRSRARLRAAGSPIDPGNGDAPVERKLLHALDLGGEAGADVVGLALDTDERARRLLAREHLGRVGERKGGLDDVGRNDVRDRRRTRWQVRHGAHHTTGSQTDISPAPRLPHAK